MRLFIPLLFTTVLFTSCGPDQETQDADAAAALEGRWELTEARRDNVKTNLLNGLYLVFHPDGSFETNLLTNEAQVGTYQRNGAEIVTAGVEAPLTYEMETLEENTLHLRSRYEGFLFDFTLRRAESGIPPPATED